MKKLLLIVSVALVTYQYLFAQGFDPAWANRFQTVLDSVVALHSSLGASVAVYVPDVGIWEGASGLTSSGIPMTTEMRLGIGSNTKTFTAAVMLKLQELGMLSLEDHLYQWLPAFPRVDSTVTLRQLLSHQSGIYDYAMDNNFWNAVWADTSHFWTNQEVLSYLWIPTFPAGGGSSYSNTNYLLASMVIEAVTGNTFVQALHQFIFDPLEMDSTFVGAHESPNGLVASWCNGSDTLNYPVTSVFSPGSAAGAIFSTSREMCQWYHALFNGEIISDSSLAEMLDFESSSFYGLGMICGWGENPYYPWYLHGGNAFSYNSQVIYDIKTQSVLCILANDLSIENCDSPIYPLMKVLLNEYPKKQKDAGITEIIYPGIHICDSVIAPIVVLKNFGFDPLTSVNINYSLETGAIVTYSWSGFLASGSTENVSLDSFVTDNGHHILKCYTSQPNGGTEEYSINDSIKQDFVINGASSLAIPWEEDFEETGFLPTDWIEDPMTPTQWGISNLVSYDGSSCLVKGNYLDINHIGIEYDVDLPMMELSGSNDSELKFWYAYACTQGWYTYDSLRIMISQDCGASWQTIFYKGGYNLATAVPVQRAFVPTASQWRERIIPLTEFSGNIMIRFRLISGFSNNLYIDDIKVDYAVGSDEIYAGNRTLIVYPNPFSSSTTIKFSLEKAQQIRISIWNQVGQQVEELTNEYLNEGPQQITWNAEGVPAGIYYCRIQAGNYSETEKMILIK